jgi:hypothetical protein
VLLPGLTSIIVLSVLQFCLLDSSWLWQLAADGLAICIATGCAVSLNKCRSFDKAFLCAVFTLLPFVLFDLANLLYDMGIGDFCLLVASGKDSVDQETLRAHFSALLITCWHFVTALIGIVMGLRLTKTLLNPDRK